MQLIGATARTHNSSVPTISVLVKRLFHRQHVMAFVFQVWCCEGLFHKYRHIRYNLCCQVPRIVISYFFDFKRFFSDETLRRLLHAL